MVVTRLRHGFTTGACATAAAKGAALMLREQRLVEEVEIILPAGRTVGFRLVKQEFRADTAACSVVKDGGDDPDVTNGAEIRVSVTFHPGPNRRDYILVDGGDGVGRVTKPGLAVAVGEPAINPVPRRMIREVVKEIFAIRCLPGTFVVTVSVPNGAELAKKTLNQRLGIVGGLSILGTTGIVTPISAKAWTDTIDAAIDVALACGCNPVVLSTGRTSELVAMNHLGLKVQGSGHKDTQSLAPYALCPVPEEAFVLMGDHVGHALRACQAKGVGEVVLAGQFAKLLKIAAGNEQTHAMSADLDLQALADWLAATPSAGHLPQLARRANTARQVLEASGNTTVLIELVCGRVRAFARQLAPGVAVKVLLAGYNGEVLYFE
jgi:cobalt-precorrin-5B (C1)-methyltransferase